MTKNENELDIFGNYSNCHHPETGCDCSFPDQLSLEAMTNRCEKCDHVLSRHLDVDVQPGPCVVTYCRCLEFVEQVETETIKITINRVDAEFLVQHYAPTMVLPEEQRIVVAIREALKAEGNN